MLAFPFGPLLGGWLLNHFWWGSVFLINIPVVVLAFLAVVAWLAESQRQRGRWIDAGGVVLSSVALTALTYGLIEIGERGWTDAAVFGPILGGMAALALFVLWERRPREPLVDLSLFANARFTVGTVLATAAATGPVLASALHSATGNWNLADMAIIVLLLVNAAFSPRAGRGTA
ncbi:hypothetical protein [Nonomuraea jabiensis]|uniref:hypothetical protein n=1 Tax=Nonomuraea jabiensis TaxID=882448 RepID=UPI003D70AF1F